MANNCSNDVLYDQRRIKFEITKPLEILSAGEPGGVFSMHVTDADGITKVTKMALYEFFTTLDDRTETVNNNRIIFVIGRALREYIQDDSLQVRFKDAESTDGIMSYAKFVVKFGLISVITLKFQYVLGPEVEMLATTNIVPEVEE